MEKGKWQLLLFSALVAAFLIALIYAPVIEPQANQDPCPDATPIVYEKLAAAILELQNEQDGFCQSLRADFWKADNLEDAKLIGGHAIQEGCW